MKITLSIIIVTWNTRDLLSACLASLFEHPPKVGFDVYVVDNGSKDGTDEMVRSKYPQVTLISNRENLGFAAANNQAVEHAKGRFLLFLNSDTEIPADSLDSMIEALEQEPSIGILGPRVESPDGRLQRTCARSSSPWLEFVHLVCLETVMPGKRHNMKSWKPGEMRFVNVIQGSCLMIRRKVLEEIGNWDERFFMYCEDDDLCERCRHAGWRVGWWPQAVISHHGGAGAGAVPDRMFLEFYRSKILFYRKNRTRPALRRLKLMLWSVSVLYAGVGVVAGLLPARLGGRAARIGSRFRLLIPALKTF